MDMGRGTAKERARAQVSNGFLSWAGISVPVISLALAYGHLLDVLLSAEGSLVLGAGRSLTIAVLSSLLVLGGLVYLIARLGYLQRKGDGAHPARSELERPLLAQPRVPSVCILIPSYKEEIHILRQTIVSAALAVYPSRRLVVLLDDPPRASGADLLALDCARHLVRDLHDRFHEASVQLRSELSDFLERRSGVAGCHPTDEAIRVAALYDKLARWIEELGSDCVRDPMAGYAHMDRFFLKEIIATSAADCRKRASELHQNLPTPAQLEHEYRRLADFLSAPINSFERKQYENLSHAPNKAMNLNTYIGLIGKSFRAVSRGGLQYLEECQRNDADLIVPECDYLLTLDADSFILPGYISQLADIMRSGARIAVAQTPYSAIPGSPNWLERAAGAQTDLQYIVHQGFTYFDATYWVGANALLRHRALLDIATFVEERGHRVPVFIQDRTPIEDTESTVDLIRQSWKLHNHPDRLAYSATPRDFGSLLIQRRRWANGGLIIFADLLRYASSRDTAGRPSALELLMRAHYLCSPALAGALIILAVLSPEADTTLLTWLLLAALPYQALSGLDLRRASYTWRDVAGVYALSLMLVPINCAGVLRTIQQMVTGKKAAFARTPKVEDRTRVPAVHVVLQFCLFAGVIGCAGLKLYLAEYYLATLYGVNAVFLAYGLCTFIGFREACEDLVHGFWAGAPVSRARRVDGSRPLAVLANSTPKSE